MRFVRFNARAARLDCYCVSVWTRRRPQYSSVGSQFVGAIYRRSFCSQSLHWLVPLGNSATLRYAAR